MEIDFGALPTMDPNVRFKIHIIAETESGDTFKDTYTYHNPTRLQARCLVKESFESAEWKVREGEGAKLVIEGYKGKRVQKLELRTEGLPKGNEPTVRRLPDEKK